MCDTMAVTPSASGSGAMFFAKNSDRNCNEAQIVEVHAAAQHSADAALRCTYLSIPQARQTHAVLLCRPFWIWGAEMGANAHGVVIGNEGLQARSPAPETPALTGMDLVRLALERAASAAAAVEVITTLLERHGQGGNCGHGTPAYYNNGFLVTDRHEAFVLETVDRDWVVARAEGVRTISNAYSISTDALRARPALAARLEGCVNYADAIGAPGRDHLGTARGRAARSDALLRAQAGQVTAQAMMRTLRDHGSDGRWSPRDGGPATICMHAGIRANGEASAGQTVGSLVSELRSSTATHWVTASAAPCLSVFKPVLLGTPLPPQEPAPTGRFDASTAWWRHEVLHRRAVRGDFPEILAQIRDERDAIEAGFVARIATLPTDADDAERARAVVACWLAADAAEARWSREIAAHAAPDDETAFDRHWAASNRDACFPT